MAPERPRPVFMQAPAFPSVLIDAHTAVATKMSLAETLAYMQRRLEQGLEIVGEIVLRIVQELGDARGRELLERVQFATWGVPVPRRRTELETLPSIERRHRLPDLARDVERGLGPVRRHAAAAPARDMLTSIAGC
ncbi:MAG TPA: hypothetical protein VFT55_12640 [Planctomycetota bacterium]|nr:hypothetical protein [Planctomycetota bacterium]